MRHLLIHPTHRKFIRLLRGRIKAGYPIIFTQSDIDALRNLWNKETMSMIDRHQSIYRIVLTALFRSVDQIDKNEKVCLIGGEHINLMEQAFFEAERKHLRTTLLSGYVFPGLMCIAKKGPKWVIVILAWIIKVVIGSKEFETIVSETTINK